jgi:hypothetical protein
MDKNRHFCRLEECSPTLPSVNLMFGIMTLPASYVGYFTGDVPKEGALNVHRVGFSCGCENQCRFESCPGHFVYCTPMKVWPGLSGKVARKPSVALASAAIQA